MTIENFDFFCVDFGKRIADSIRDSLKAERLPTGEVGNVVTRALGVLHSNGVYAFLLHVLWKEHNGTPMERKVFSAVDEYLIGRVGAQSLLRLGEIGLGVSAAGDALELGKALSKDIDGLFFAKELLGRTLTYLRYHAKAL